MAIKIQNQFMLLDGGIKDGKITCEWELSKLYEIIAKDKVVVILKNVFPEQQLLKLRDTVWDWSKETPLAESDDFLGNQHRHRCLISKQQQCPYLFHDHTFDNIPLLPEDFQKQMYAIYEPLKDFWNELTGQNYQLVVPPVPQGEPYFHPQITHYPVGGSFFGRHWHNFEPQRVGMIVSMSRYGLDYDSGSNTNFEVYNEIVRTEGHHNIGDITLFPYDVSHWIDNSSPAEKFDWNNKKGRWVAILPLYDPWGAAPTTAEHDHTKKTKEELGII